ncbi:hypothetical protein Asppvi_004828 [Aspergillus pseudoviridinutans]|uniref:Alcohol dehydrogenase n=1 Tax=Aspergillus pseudoviridinutans TaxID=1517512 RepID=A0A9P3ETT3_9EURO|nr:uncharacterized protein Asppvi_004828 [Aspergillus pseudoviridinutans]GIJ85957.1 hypothetical protein Asppvi_004828 [Aspergillus pseudoviridinutans]
MSQKALILQEIGHRLVEVNRPIPQPGKGEFLIKLTSVGLNPHDQKSRDRGLFVTSTPYIPAHDLAGEIITIGPDTTTDFAIGEHIFAQSRLPLNQVLNDFNGLQQYALVDIKYAARVTDTGLSDDEAATIPVNVATGFVVFFSEGGFGLPLPDSVADFDYASQKLVVIGAATNCGRYAIQFAKWLGFGVIVAVAGLRTADEMREIGATHVIDRHAEDVLSQVRDIVGDELVYALDAFNFGPKQELGVAVLSDSRRGTLVTLAPAVGEVDSATIGEKRMGFERRFIRGSCATHPDDFTKLFWERITGWLKEGVIRPSKFRVIEGLVADKINAALDEYRDMGGMKVQVHPNV